MRKLLRWILLFLPLMVTAQSTSAPKPDIIASYPGMLHEHLNRSCELVQPVTLIHYKHYDALELAGTTDELYAPELRRGDFVALSPAISKDVAKSAKKSGFDVRPESSGAPADMTAKPLTNGGSCPDLQQTIAEANNRRNERRVDLQAHLYRVGPDVLLPVPIQQVQPELQVGNPNVKDGTVILAMTVGIDGRVHDAHVVRSLDVKLDQKAAEAVQQWTFSPARKNGLPVPVQINGEVTFHLR